MLASTASFAAKPAHNFTLPTSNGQIKLQDYRGKVVYLDFWASWCVPCRHSFPWMNDMQKKYKGKGLEVVTINMDKERALADKFLKKHPANFVVAYDPEGATAESYGVMGMPSSYIIDRKGNIIYQHIGFREKTKSKLEAHISSALTN
ncbi:MAG: TlpA family protein disulfide reductase [Proteobacteria bacterium]|nr:TlpA family protein disulfide reductase [Pseudomonadota bacterium]